MKERERDISKAGIKITSLGEAKEELKTSLAQEIQRTQNFESDQGSLYASGLSKQETIHRLQDEVNRIKMELTKCQRQAYESEQNARLVSDQLVSTKKLAEVEVQDLKDQLLRLETEKQRASGSAEVPISLEKVEARWKEHYEKQLTGVTVNLREQHKLETNDLNSRVKLLEGQVQQGVNRVAELERKLDEARHYQKLEDKHEWEKIVLQAQRRNAEN